MVARLGIAKEPANRVCRKVRLSSDGIHLLRDEAEHRHGAHEEHSVVELPRMMSCRHCTPCLRTLTAFRDTDRSSSSVRASMKSRRRLGKLAWWVSKSPMRLYLG